MKKAILLLALYVACNLTMFVLNSNAQAPNWAWAKSAGGGNGNDDAATSVTTDGSGNIYEVGAFWDDSITFGTFTLIKVGTFDLFIVKYDANGNVIWAKSAGGNFYDVPWSVTGDASGNIYIVGYFTSQTLVFDSTTLTNVGSGAYSDMFTAKYDPSGNVIWAKSAGGIYYDEANAVTTDPSGNIYVTGSYYNDSITFGSTTLNNDNSSDIFIVKYDNNGNVVWAKGAGGSDWERAKAITFDTFGNIYVTGYFNSPVFTVDSFNLNNASANNTDMFILKYDANGNLQWAKRAGGYDNDNANSITADLSGNIYVGGSFVSPLITFGVDTLNNSGLEDLFLVKYDSSGNAIWAKSAGGIRNEIASSITSVGSGNVYVTGYFGSDSVTFGSILLTKNLLYVDLFVAKYNTNGDVLWAKSAVGSGEDETTSIATDLSGGIYVTGDFFYNDSLTFGNTTLVNTVSNGVLTFIAKLDGTTGINQTFNTQYPIYISPNPFTNELTVHATKEKGAAIIYDVTGKEIMRIKTSDVETKINTTLLIRGFYLLNYSNGNEHAIIKLVKF